MGTTLSEPYYCAGDSAQDVLEKLPFHHYDAQEMPDTKLPGYSPVIRHELSVGGFPTILHPELETAYDFFEHSLKRVPERKYLGFRDSQGKYQYLTYAETQEKRTALGSGLVKLLHELGVSEFAGTVISIYLPNCYQFSLVDLAAQAYSLVSTPLYDTLGEASFLFIFSLTQSPIVVTHKEKVSTIVGLKIPSLKVVVTVEDLDLAADHELFHQTQGILLLDLKSLISLGSGNLIPHRLPKPHDPFTISFTSGTTSFPKGVVITHAVMAAQAVYFVGVLPYSEKRKPQMTFLLLPLAHVYTRAMFHMDTLCGYTIHYPSKPGNVLASFADVKEVKPVAFMGVPRVLNRIEQMIKSKFNLSSYIGKAIQYKVDRINENKDSGHFVYDRFFAPKVKSALGFDNIKFIASGSAAISRESLVYLRAVFNVPAIQGIGFTEAAGGLSCSSPGTDSIGTNGVIAPVVEMKLKDVPEMDYTFKLNRAGELLLRGPSMCTGYYKQQKLFDENVEEGGWYKTGDICQLDEKNRIYVLDRVKNFFKLSQGKFVASEKVQNTYLASSILLEQLFVYGTSLEPFLVGIAGINLENVIKVLNLFNLTDLHQLDNLDLQKFLKHINLKRVKKVLLKKLNESLSPGDLASYEMLKNAYFTVTPFSIASNTLTPTLKVKRPQIRKLYERQISELISQGNIVTVSKL